MESLSISRWRLWPVGAGVTADQGTVGGFGLSLRFTEEQVVLGVTGEVDLVTAPEIAAILDCVVARGHTSVVLDFAGLEFLGAAGIGVIASTAAHLRVLGGELILRSSTPLLLHLLDVTGLLSVVRVEPVESLSHLGPEQAEGSQELPTLTDDELARPLRQVTAIPADTDVIDGALRMVVALARATVGGADGVSVSLRRHGRLSTVAASDQTILEMDADQYATGEGPCVEASVEGRWFHVESLEDETRWPAFIPRAKELGINAILSSPLMTEERPVGALNIYSRTEAAFAPKDQELAAIFATEASIILRDAGAAVSDDELSTRFQEALATRGVIAQAQGVLMARDGVTTDEAFASLRRYSHQTNKPLQERAAEIVASTQTSISGPFDQDEHQHG